MLRVLMENGGAIAPSIYKNGEDSTMKTGMGVVLNVASGEAEFASAASDANIYVVDKERDLAGVEIADGYEPSDYASYFNDVKAGELIKLRKFRAGEMFAVDQYDTAEYTKGSTYLKAGTDGKWEAVASGTSKYLFDGYEFDGTFDNDSAVDTSVSAGHKLMKILVLE